MDRRIVERGLVKFLSDRAIERLRSGSDVPDLTGTRYKLIEHIARGGMGVVYAAEDGKLQRRVALKVLDAADTTGTLGKRLTREAHVLARLEHPGIVPVHDVGTLADGRVFYTMKFVEGQGLDKFVESVPSLPDRLRLFLRVCDAVAFAHARGVLHRDLKPANVMVGSFGEVLVMDWGLAKVLKEAGTDCGEVTASETVFQLPEGADAGADTQATDVTGHGTVMGTPGYMSPEQARGEVESLTARSDIFSLGALLKFLASGVANGTAATPKALRAIWGKALQEDPAARYGSVTELAGDVSRYLDGLPVGAYRESFLEQLGRFYHRYQVAILLIAAYLFMRALLLLLPRG